jgi:hypothetical protein
MRLHSSGVVKLLLLSTATTIGLCSLTAVAQQTTGAAASTAATPSETPQSSPATASQPTAGPTTPQNQSGTSKDRVLFALPNFLTLENADQVPPMTAGEKYKVTARSSFDYMEFVWYGALAGIGQAKNSDAEYGQGGEGYAKRFGEELGDGAIENMMTKAVLPSLFHQDPRYFQSGKGTIKHRMLYAVSRVFITRSDSRTNQFNFSGILGSAASAGISTYSYHPRDDRNLENAIEVWGPQVGYDMISYVLKEFWPDLRRKLKKSK